MAEEKAVVHLIVAARPNFMKVAPLHRALAKADWCRPVLVHTGQHYDENMSGAFLQDLGLPPPQVHLHVGSGSHAEQTAGVMLAYEKVCLDSPPDWVVVVGDVNSTMAVAITAKKLWLPVAHLEAGLRSGDRTMPEEINRLVTDALSDLLWTPSPDADENLRREGIPEERIVRVGNIMIDSYELLREKIEAQDTVEALGLETQRYGVVTLHRPSNVDREEALAPLVEALVEIGAGLPLVFPVHPRTLRRLEETGLIARLEAAQAIQLHEPLGYVPFMSLVRQAGLVITDSGGLQEETTYLDVPCLTVRDTTERPITLTQGSNRLVPAAELPARAAQALRGEWPRGRRPELWDGQTAGRAARSLKQALGR